MENSVHDRLLIFINSLNLNVNSFAKQLGVNPTVVHNVVKGRRTKPSFDLIHKIKLEYTYLNLDWLIIGEGEMLLSINNIVEEPRATYQKKNKKIGALEKEMGSMRAAVERLQKDVKKIKKKLN